MPKKGHSQESVFVYKTGRARQSLRDACLGGRFSRAQKESPKLARQRISKFLEARELIDQTAERLQELHFEHNVRALSALVNTTEPGTLLPVVFLLRADVKSYINKIREFEPDWHTISIHSKECVNLKATLKLIVNRVIESNSELVSDRRLTYDLGVISDWFEASGKHRETEQIVVVVEDTDGFDSEIVRSLITHMHSYVSSAELRLSLVLNLSIPLPLLEESLSQKNIVSMKAKVLQGLPPVNDFTDACSLALQGSASLQLVLSQALVAKLSIHDITRAQTYLQYAVLGHFAGNPLCSANNLEELRQQRALLERLPSVHQMQAANPSFLDELLSGDTPMGELPFIIPEMQVGGKVLDIVFDPNYRPLIEQALMDPRLYVSSEEEIDRMSVPFAALYQLMRESNSYVNIFDCYSAFKEMIRPIPDCEDWDRQSLAVFLDAVTSFKMMGVIRDCKRKYECVEKVSWKGV